MKYNEAIDMILDGGVARKLRDASKIRFSDSILVNAKTGDPFVCYDFDITSTEWIVEKDGVVYSEYKEKEMPLNEKYQGPIHLNCPNCAEPLMELSQKIDEDWLEKKMLCVMQKIILAADSLTDEALSFDEITRVRPEDLGDLENMDCGHEYCPFCFPKEKEEKKPCTCTQANGQIITCAHCVKWYIEEPPDKVTVSDIYRLIKDIEILHWEKRAGHIAYADALNQEHDIKLSLDQKLTYLVNLQEK